MITLAGIPHADLSTKRAALRALVHCGLEGAQREVALRLNASRVLRKIAVSEPSLSGDIAVLLALLGESGPTELSTPDDAARPLRCLCLDGGGSKGLVAIEVLIEVEDRLGKPLYEAFDIICGTSTGGILASYITLVRKPMRELQQLYFELSQTVFNDGNSFTRNIRLVTQHHLHNGNILQNLIARVIGTDPMIRYNQEERQHTPKLFLVSSIVSVRPAVPFLFRNYDYGKVNRSRYPGSCRMPVDQALRASCAAPTYFEEIVHHIDSVNGEEVFN